MGWVGTAAALLLFLVPLSTMRAIMRRGSVAEYSCVPYNLSLAQCMLWATYALPMVTPCKQQPLITNSLGSTCLCRRRGVFRRARRIRPPRRIVRPFRVGGFGNTLPAIVQHE